MALVLDYSSRPTDKLLDEMELYELELEYDAVDRAVRNAECGNQRQAKALTNYLTQIGKAIESKRRKGRGK